MNFGKLYKALKKIADFFVALRQAGLLNKGNSVEEASKREPSRKSLH